MIEQILQGDRYLQVDQVEQARAIYQGVVDLDPNNAIATVGLAQCALADEHDQEAYELAAHALQLDPENDMARRMEARLAEVLTVRGEDVQRPDEAKSPASADLRPVVTATAEQPSAAAPAATTATKADPGSPATKTDPGSPARRSLLDRLMGR